MSLPPVDSGDEDGSVSRYSTSPPLTGTLHLNGWLRYVVPKLLNLPNGLLFREFTGHSLRKKSGGKGFRWRDAPAPSNALISIVKGAASNLPLI